MFQEIYFDGCGFTGCVVVGSVAGACLVAGAVAGAS